MLNRVATVWAIPGGGMHQGSPVAKKKPEAPSTGDQVGELKNMVVGYAKQETIDPLKSLGRYVGFGAGGSDTGTGCN